VIFTLRNISGAVYSHSKSRWFDMDTFNQWFVLLLHFQTKRWWLETIFDVTIRM